jgi:hypothetical protein
VRVNPRVTQLGMLADDVHGWCSWHTVEVTCSDDVPPNFRCLAGKLGELPSIDKPMSLRIFWSLVPTLGEQLTRALSVQEVYKSSFVAYMCIKYLHLSKDRVGNEYTGSCLAYEPIPGHYVDWRAVKRIWMDSCGQYRKARQYNKSCSQSTAGLQRLVSPVARPLILTCRRILSMAVSGTPPLERVHSPRTPRVPGA